MGNLLLNGQTAFTQTGTAAPVLASTVNLGSATFPAGHVVQTVTDIYEPTGGLNISGANDEIGSDLEVTIQPNSTSNITSEVAGPAKVAPAIALWTQVSP